MDCSYIGCPVTRISIIFLVSLALLAGCGDPPCDGEVTTGLTGSADGCPSGGVDGEQMCPDESWCGVTPSCTAYEDWKHGACACPAPSRTCCDLDIIWPPGDSILSLADDADLGRPGLQLDVTAQAGCWGEWHDTMLKVAVCGEDAMIPEGFADPGTTVDTYTLATGRIDLGDAVGCFPLCADVVLWGSTVLTHTSIEICVE